MVIRLTALIGLLLIFISLALLYVNFPEGGRSIILRSGFNGNEPIAGGRSGALMIAVSGLALVLGNTVLARMLERRHPFAARTLAAATVVLAALILAVIGGIIVIN